MIGIDESKAKQIQDRETFQAIYGDNEVPQEIRQRLSEWDSVITTEWPQTDAAKNELQRCQGNYRESLNALDFLISLAAEQQSLLLLARAHLKPVITANKSFSTNLTQVTKEQDGK